jgi:hypothetical protein
MHHLCPTITCVAIATVSAVPTQAQECTTLDSSTLDPLPGVSSFSASVTRSWAGINGCLGGNPPQTCSDVCHAQVSGLSGVLTMSLCSVWIPIDPGLPGHPGYWCSPATAAPLVWGTASNFPGSGSVRLFGNDPGFPNTTGSVQISLVQPVRATWFVGWVSGGRFLSKYGGGEALYINAGENVTLRTEGGGSFIFFGYDLCPDTDSNGICDAYDTAARAFGDFDSSGSIDGVDLATLLAAWGTAGGVCDINRDGVVDANDLTFLLARWGQGA